MDERRLTGTSISEDGRIMYDPIGGEKVNTKPPYNRNSSEQLLEIARCQEAFFDEIFYDVKPGAVISGPTEQYGLTINDIKSFNYGQFGNELYSYIASLGSKYLDPEFKMQIRFRLLSIIRSEIESNSEDFNRYRSTRIGTFVIKNHEKRNKDLTEIIKLFDKFTRRVGKIGYVDYEIKFSYRTKRTPETADDLPVFVDSEGLCLPIYQISDISMGEGIYVLKLTPESTLEEPFIVLPLPTEGECTPSEILNGVFFHSVREYKETYKRELKVSYDKSSEDERLFNNKKLIGRYLFNEVTQTSHGLVSIIQGCSLTRNSFYTCSPESGITEIVNITPDSLGQSEFVNAISEFGLTKELLASNDYIIRRTNVGSGSGRTSSRNTRYERIKLGKKTGLNELSQSIMDNDLAILNETGVAVFSTLAAAERCMDKAGGNIDKYIHLINSKVSNKTEKHIFVDSLKSAALMGVGAVVPKVIEQIIKSTTKEATMSIMKPMLPPITKVVSGAILGGAMKYSIMKTVSYSLTTIVPIVGVGVGIMNLVDGIVSLSTGFSNFTITAFIPKLIEFGKSAFGFVKNVGVGLWNIASSTFMRVFDGIKMIFSPDKTFTEKLKNIFEGVVDTVKDTIKWTYDRAVDVFNIVKQPVMFIVDGACNIAKGVFDWFGGVWSGMFA